MLTRKMIVGMIMVVLVSMTGTAEGVVGYEDDLEGLEKPEYAPDEIIVKFWQPVADSLEQQLSEGKAVEELKLSASLDDLNLKYKVRNIEAVFKTFKADRRRIEELLRKDEAVLTKRERYLVRRLKRAPKDAIVPELDRIYKIEFEPGQSAPDAAAEYSRDGDVEYAELNYIVSICIEPNDPNYCVQWPLANVGQMYPASGNYRDPPGTPDCDIDANEAWDIYTGSSDIIVAVVDTGVDYNHRDLSRNMWTDANGFYGYDFVNDDNDPMDDKGHGTHCAGIIAAEGNNGFDIAGVSWNAKIMAVKFLDAGGSGLYDEAAQAINYATNNGADVISNSWGGGEPKTPFLKEAIDYAHSQGVVQVAAAGNGNTSSPHWPAYYDHMISVAATDSNDDKATFSNYGDWVDLAAPGVDILSLRASEYFNRRYSHPYRDPDATMCIMSGTSMACPHVSGACALLLSIDPATLGPNDVNDILTTTADELDDPNICKSGRLNLYKAMLEAIPSKGNINLDRDYYNSDCNVGIFLADCDLEGAGTQDVNIVTSGGDLETVTLAEKTPAVGVFTGTISTASGDPNTGDGILQVSHDETITLTYEDANDGSGNPASPNDTATVDCVDPNIVSDIKIEVVPYNTVVTFETDEPTLGRVLYGLSCGGPYNSDTGWGTDHTIKLIGLSPWTDYYFKVIATDAGGNEIVDNNDGNCYTFTTDGPNDLNVPGDFNTIQEAIDYSWDGGTVTVAEGTHNEEKGIDFKGKTITVRSTAPNDWTVVEQTIIDVNGQPYNVVEFSDAEGTDSVLTGLTVTGGHPVGCGIRCNGASPVITRCIISNNGGFGIGCIHDADPIISNCIIKDNWWGIRCDADPTITECVIKNNSDYGIRAVGSAAEIKNNWIYDNGDTGILCIFSDNTVIRNNTVANNTSYGIRVTRGAAPEISNCILWDNGDELYNCTATYSCIKSCSDADGEGNICGDGNDPNFFDADANDFHLNPDSPCIDAGDPNGDYSGQSDIDGEPRIMRGRVDMGADEFLRVHNVTKNTWYIHIQDAIDDANDANEASDIIEVYPDIYNETIDFNGISCTLTSVDLIDWDVVANTIIDANGGTRGVYFHNSEDANSVLTGFIVTGGTQGVDCSSASPIISNCIIEDNDNCGVYCYNSASPVITNNRIRENGLRGVECRGGAPKIKNNWIHDNSYGIGLAFGSSPVITNNTIVNNSNYGINTGPGGATPTISNCILWGHDNNDLSSGFSATYSCIEDCNDANGVGNICGDANDPLFIDANNGDYHLDSNSPCIDVGDPNGDYDFQKDIDGHPRVMVTEVDMGGDEAAYMPTCHPDYSEWVSVGKPVSWCFPRQCHGDADGLKLDYPNDPNGPFWVQQNDLDILNDGWKKPYSGDPEQDPWIAADFDHEQGGNPKTGYYRVGINDLNILVENWESNPDPNCQECP